MIAVIHKKGKFLIENVLISVIEDKSFPQCSTYMEVIIIEFQKKKFKLEINSKDKTRIISIFHLTATIRFY